MHYENRINTLQLKMSKCRIFYLFSIKEVIEVHKEDYIDEKICIWN